MGNRTYLRFEDFSEFEANNCLPVTWLTLFDPSEFVIKEVKEMAEEDEEDGETSTVVGYQTSPEKALLRVNEVIKKYKGKTLAWFYLRPVEILQKEIEYCLGCPIISLDMTQFYFYHDTYQRVAMQAGDLVKDLLQKFDGSETDVALLAELISKLSLGGIVSLSDLDPSEMTFLLVGTYYGDAEREEEEYSISFFEETYWKR